MTPLIIIFLLLFPSTLSADDLSYCGFESYKEYREVRDAKKMHGIKFAKCNARGEWTFERNNQVCKLISKGVR